MLGSKGPSVILQRPCSSLASLGGGVAPSQSPVSVTSDALGAKMRKVTRWSGETSGDFTVSAGPRGGAWPKAADMAAAAQAQIRRCFINETPERGGTPEKP